VRVFGIAWRVEQGHQRFQAGGGPAGITLGEIADREVAAAQPLPVGGGQHADAAVRLAQPPRQLVVL
jgi:hypothetical protein